ncbi:hypothetical protein PIB30_089485 [Stylosanthes scabra]|uniref:Uncharacterized protein n=1 Tax=Stylosanthes scabra TaxID=79078 RepID=A0ABU6ZSU4_9FABA|nr:hypothetical protein [Stylosanthes scabra]
MALGRSGKMDHHDADDRVIVVTNSGNTGDEETVCDSAAEVDIAAEAEMPTDNSAEALTGRRTGPRVMADDTADAMMADDTATVMADNTANPDTADLGQDDTEGVALAYIPGPRRADGQNIPVQSDPSSDHRTPALIMHINPIGYVLLSTVLSLLVNIFSTRLVMRPSTCSRPSPFLRTSGRCIRARFPRAGASRRRTIGSLDCVAAGAHHPVIGRL